MLKYLFKRLIQSTIVMFGITIIVFLIIHLAPGDPVEAMLALDPNASQEDIELKREVLGLNQPIHIQYLKYMKGVLKGDFGTSIQYERPVTDLISERMWNTFGITFTALSISILIAVPIGVISATKQYSKFDYSTTTFAFFGVSIPSFFFGLLLMKVFSVNLGILPSSGMQTAGNNFTGIEKIVDYLIHGIMPITVLALINVARFTRFTRSSMLEVIKQDYIRTARAKGLKRKVVIYKHALRNAMIPVITVIGASIAYLFSGALIVETVFSWPGLGRMIYSSTMSRDYYIMMGINIFIAFLVILGNLLADLLYSLVDPRIKFD